MHFVFQTENCRIIKHFRKGVWILANGYDLKIDILSGEKHNNS